MKPGESRRFELPSALEALRDLRAQSYRLALDHGFSPEAAEDYETCLHEAVANAMVHAHQLAEDLLVAVTVEPDGAGLRTTVADQGPGYDGPRTALGGCPPGEDPRGRGLQIICRLSDHQEWRDGGRTLVFTVSDHRAAGGSKRE